MFSLIDVAELLAAVAIAGAIVALPGVALGRLFSKDPGSPPWPALALAFAVLPLVASLCTRYVGLDGALVADLTLATAGLVVLLRDRAWRRVASLAGLTVVACWLGLLVIEWIDLDVGGRLYHPATIIDTVKHAATTQAIVESGAPPRDAFFLRPERASYYYYFYTLTALVQRASLGWVDARAAVGGLVFWVGLGLYGLVGHALQRAGLTLALAGGRRALLIVAVLGAAGLDVVGSLSAFLHEGYLYLDPFFWNEQVSAWSESLFWVPHHVTGLIASFVGLGALCDLVEAETMATRRRAGALAALAFASTLGLSIWLAMVLVATASVWCLALAGRRRWRALGWVAMTAGITCLLAMPQLFDLRAGRGGPLPIAFDIRPFALVEDHVPEGAWRELARGLSLPLNYLLEFGVLAIGTMFFWRNGERPKAMPEFHRVLAIGAATGLLIGTLVASRLYNNDLGWRVMLFPLFAGTLWTIAVVDRALAQRPRVALLQTLPRPLGLCLVLGWTTSILCLVSMRAYPWLPLQPQARFMVEDAGTEHALRTAYDWADANLPVSSVLQHNPTVTRAFAFGLYSRNPIVVSDTFGGLYGADSARVETRLQALAPLYHRALPRETIHAVAASFGIDDLVVTSADPVWRDPASFVWTTPPLYASDQVRIIPVARLGG